jgi:hypothetical protein
MASSILVQSGSLTKCKSNGVAVLFAGTAKALCGYVGGTGGWVAQRLGLSIWVSS